MPAKIPKQCRVRGCTNLTTESHGYCSEHAGLAIGWRQTIKRKGTAEQRGYGYRWKLIRTQVLRRDHYLCQPCLKNGVITPATAVDHIINKARGGADELSNLQSICDHCHQEKTINEITHAIKNVKNQGYGG